MTDDLRPSPAQPDPIADATEQVVETWREATPGKEPTATADDFERMRDGVADLTDDGDGPPTG